MIMFYVVQLFLAHEKNLKTKHEQKQQNNTTTKYYIYATYFTFFYFSLLIMLKAKSSLPWHPHPF